MSKIHLRTDWQDVAQAFSNVFKITRVAQRFSILGLAKEARVSSRMVTRLENPEELKNTLRYSQGKGGHRQKTAFSRVLIQLAIVLEKDPRKWLQQLQLDWEGNNEYEDLLRAATTRVANRRTVPLADELARSSGEPSIGGGRISAGRILRVSLVPLGSFAKDEMSSGSRNRSFFEEFADRVIGSYRHELKGVFTQVNSDIRRTLLRQLNPNEQPSMIIGLLDVMAREFGTWAFCRIPLFRVKISFLVPQWALNQTPSYSWQNFLGITPLATDVGEPKVMVVKESSAELLLMGACRQGDSDWERLESFRANDLATQFAKLIQAMKKQKRMPILAVDQVTGFQVLSKLSGEHLVDLADTDGEGVPSYQLSIAVRAGTGDEEFAQRLQRIVESEMFDNHAAISAELYARYLAQVIWSNKIVIERYKKCVEMFRAERKGSHRPSEMQSVTLPSFARLSDTSPAVSTLFRRELVKRLKDSLTAHPSSEIKAIGSNHIKPLVPETWYNDVILAFE